MDDEFRVSRLLRIFHKWSESETPRVKRFEKWPKRVRVALSQAGRIAEDECPFLAFYASPSRWTVLTLRRVIWRNNDDVGCARFVDLKYVTDKNLFAEMAQELENSPDLESEMGKIAHDVKSRAHELLLVPKRGRLHVVEFEPGEAFFGFWNVVRLMITQARSNT